VLLFPANPEECFYMSAQAFDLADELQTPVIVMSDLDIGMNDWMCPDLVWDEAYQPKRGKVLTPEQLDGMDKFYRYLDVDGDGITYRTLPGEHPKGSFFTRGSGHNRFGAYTEDSKQYQDVVDRLLIKWETARNMVPKPEIAWSKFNKRAILTVGSGDGAVKEALVRLKENGTGLNYCRVKAFPFDESVREFIDQHEFVYVVEQNRDAQLRSLLILDLEIDPRKLKSILHYDGMPISASFVTEKVLEHQAKGRAA
jgi:2-oxoglutarate/2-oxoacid ferredoxin oxidoreductase subunit alpha